MIRKIVAAAALAALSAAPAFAATNVDFEATAPNAAGWTAGFNGGVVTAFDYGVNTNITLTDEYSPGLVPGSSDPTLYQYSIGALSAPIAGAGGRYGLFSLCSAYERCSSAADVSFNSDGGSLSGGQFFLRLITMDVVDYANGNDFVKLAYYDANNQLLRTDTIDVAGMANGSLGLPAGTNTDSGWISFGTVDPNTTKVALFLSNGGDVGNSPLAAVDYVPAAQPVPEADASAMMLAGLGVLGMVARRRRVKASV